MANIELIQLARELLAKFLETGYAESDTGVDAIRLERVVRYQYRAQKQLVPLIWTGRELSVFVRGDRLILIGKGTDALDFESARAVIALKEGALQSLQSEFPPSRPVNAIRMRQLITAGGLALADVKAGLLKAGWRDEAVDVVIRGLGPD